VIGSIARRWPLARGRAMARRANARVRDAPPWPARPIRRPIRVGKEGGESVAPLLLSPNSSPLSSSLTRQNSLSNRHSSKTTTEQAPRAAARRATAAPARVSRASRAVSVRAEADTKLAVAYCEPKDVRKLVDDRGYIVLDIRMIEENAEAAKWWWKNLPLFVTLRSGDVVRNNKFQAMFEAAFPNKMSRAIILCDETGERSELVWEEIIAPGGFTAMKVLKGGAEAYFTYEPLDQKDLKPKWKLVGQTSGVRYSHGDGETDDSA
jgi:hypothetical protein